MLYNINENGFLQNDDCVIYSKELLFFSFAKRGLASTKLFKFPTTSSRITTKIQYIRVWPYTSCKNSFFPGGWGDEKEFLLIFPFLLFHSFSLPLMGGGGVVVVVIAVIAVVSIEALVIAFGRAANRCDREEGFKI